jgi:hypothetical protein
MTWLWRLSHPLVEDCFRPLDLALEPGHVSQNPLSNVTPGVLEPVLLGRHHLDQLSPA